MYPDPLILPPQAVAFTNAFSINSRLDTRQHIHGNVVPISDGNFFIGKKCAHKRPEVTKYFLIGMITTCKDMQTEKKLALLTMITLQ